MNVPEKIRQIAEAESLKELEAVVSNKEVEQSIGIGLAFMTRHMQLRLDALEDKVSKLEKEAK